VTTLAQRPGGIDAHVPDLSRHAMGALKQFSVRDDAAAYAGALGYVN
jgi:hypothetical protein